MARHRMTDFYPVPSHYVELNRRFFLDLETKPAFLVNGFVWYWQHTTATTALPAPAHIDILIHSFVPKRIPFNHPTILSFIFTLKTIGCFADNIQTVMG